LLFGIGENDQGTVRVDNVLVYQNRPTAPLGIMVDVRRAPYNAVPGDSVLDTAAIQKAIDDLPAGGTVLLTGGVFLSGTLRLKSTMTLWVARGATLRGSQNLADYPPIVGAPITFNPWYVLLYTLDAENVNIDGGGTIDGNGNKPGWIGESGETETRPVLLALMRGSNLSVRNVYVKDAPAWAIVPVEVAGLLIADVNIDSNLYANRDGIDVIDSDDVLIERTSVWSDDDSICFKSYTTKGVNGATVRLSTVGKSERANGVKFGVMSAGAFRDVTVEDTLIKDTDKAAITVTAVYGGVVRGLSFRRITVDDARRIFFVQLGQRADGAQTPRTPKWASGLRFEHIVGTRLDSASIVAGQVLNGTTYRVYDVLVSGIQAALPTAAAGRYLTAADEYDGSYPESSRWPSLPSAGYYFWHVDGARVNASSLLSTDARPMVASADTLNRVLE